MKQVKPLTEFLTKEELYKLYSEAIQEIEEQQKEIDSLILDKEYLLEENKKLKEMLQKPMIDDYSYNKLSDENSKLKDELFDVYRMQLKGMVVGGQLDWIRNRLRELDED